MPERITKLQRHLDLIAFLVGRRYPVSIDEIMAAVPAYAEGWDSDDETTRASTRRKFERDKDELKRLGIPLRSVGYRVTREDGDDDESSEGYEIPSRDFYLPYLRLLRESAGPEPPPRGTPSAGLAVREDEVRDAAEALYLARELPHFPLRREADSALRKLSFDLDPAALRPGPLLQVHPPEVAELGDRLRALGDALLARKWVRFRYHGIHRDRVTERDVAPYGLFLKFGNWYLVAHDGSRNATRTFRLDRMEALEPNTRKPGTPDYDVPEDFDLHAYTHRQAWELGDDQGVDADVRFRFPRSLWAARNEHGELVEELEQGAQVRRFRVRQVDPFLRWILSLAGDADIEAPPALRARLREMGRAVADAYGRSPSPPAEGGDG